MVGEIRTPDAADELLRASVSGHLVFSTIHANNVTDALNSLVKYASASDMSEELAYDMLSRGLLSVIHQTLIGKGVKKPSVQFLMANPNTSKGDQVRGIIKTGNLNLATTIEQQMIRMARNQDLFPDID
jgi:twitching motility protein PilT